MTFEGTVMYLKHLDHALIHRLQQRLGVRRQEDELYVLMQVMQHVGVGGTIVEDHQDMEGEALRRAVLLQLMHQGTLAVFLKNVTCHHNQWNWRTSGQAGCSHRTN